MQVKHFNPEPSLSEHQNIFLLCSPGSKILINKLPSAINDRHLYKHFDN